MKLFGIDFTSTPSRRKPIVCSQGLLVDQILRIEQLVEWHSLDEFESFLAMQGSWLAAMDFPFGQPRRLITELNWPTSWDRYVRLVGRLSREEFVATISEYCAAQPFGQKHHRRTTDIASGACSPMMLYGVPVGKMFHEGAPRLQNSEVNVFPCRPTDAPKTALEGYPALVARHLIGRERYKGGTETDLREARKRLVNLLTSRGRTSPYGLEVEVPNSLQSTLIEDTHGDHLDAILSTVQAASAYLLKENRYGTPNDIDRLEGWIVDPTISHSQANQS